MANCSYENRVINQITETACLQNKVISSKITVQGFKRKNDIFKQFFKIPMKWEVDANCNSRRNILTWYKYVQDFFLSCNIGSITWNIIWNWCIME